MEQRQDQGAMLSVLIPTELCSPAAHEKQHSCPLLLLDVDPHFSLTPFCVRVCLHEATWWNTGSRLKYCHPKKLLGHFVWSSPVSGLGKSQALGDLGWLCFTKSSKVALASTGHPWHHISFSPRICVPRIWGEPIQLDNNPTRKVYSLYFSASLFPVLSQKAALRGPAQGWGQAFGAAQPLKQCLTTQKLCRDCKCLASPQLCSGFFLKVPPGHQHFNPLPASLGSLNQVSRIPKQFLNIH